MEFIINTIKAANIQIIDGDRGKNYPSQKDLLPIGDCIFLNAKNVTSAGFNFQESQWITSTKDSSLRNGRLIRDDIVLTTRGTIGNIAYYNSSVLYNCIRINSGMVILRNNSSTNINTLFLFYCLNSYNVKNQLRLYSYGSAQPQISVAVIGDIKIPLPPLDEQKRIAHVLASQDKVLEALDRLIALKEQQFRGLIQKLISQPAKAGKWDIVELGEVLKYEQPTKYLVSSEDYSSKYSTPVLTANKSILLGYTAETHGIYENLPVIIFDDFTTLNKYITYNFKIKSSAMKLLQPKKKEDNLYFIFNAMQEVRYPISTHKRYWISEYQYLPIPHPSPDEQQKIAHILDCAQKVIDTLKRKKELLKQQKRGLMQVLLTGQIRV